MASKKKSNAGRKPKKTEEELKEFIPKLEELAKMGYTNSDIASEMNISYATFYNYLEQYPFFAEALEKSKKVADDKVKAALFKKATGYYIEEMELFTDESGAVVKGKQIKRYIVPSDKAIQMYLQNREPENWREKKDVSIDHDFEIDVEIMGIDDDEQ